MLPIKLFEDRNVNRSLENTRLDLLDRRNICVEIFTFVSLLLVTCIKAETRSGEWSLRRSKEIAVRGNTDLLTTGFFCVMEILHHLPTQESQPQSYTCALVTHLLVFGPKRTSLKSFALVENPHVASIET